MNEYGETPTLYVWPVGHEGGSHISAEFYGRVTRVLAEAGIDSEWV